VEVFDAVRTVLAVREYQDKPIPADTLRRILDAAHLTASSRNGQPWHFIVIQDKEKLRRITPLAKTGAYIEQAPVAVAVAYDKASQFGVSDTSRAIQSMVLTAWSEGVGSNWVGFDGTLNEVNAEIGLPENLQLVGILPFGYPVKQLGKGKKNRKPFGEVVHGERYGTPFA
jgi:nitroreductase